MIKAIFVAKKSKQPLLQVDAVQVVMGAGITGDRHFRRTKVSGKNITFVESEAIAAFNSLYSQSISLGATRRNIVTQGVELNPLVGKEFSIGEARFRGIELCEPCNSLGRALENEYLSRTQIVKAFLTNGGLRADILRSGVIKTGMPLIPHS